MCTFPPVVASREPTLMAPSLPFGVHVSGGIAEKGSARFALSGMDPERSKTTPERCSADGVLVLPSREPRLRHPAHEVLASFLSEQDLLQGATGSHLFVDVLGLPIELPESPGAPEPEVNPDGVVRKRDANLQNRALESEPFQEDAADAFTRRLSPTIRELQCASSLHHTAPASREERHLLSLPFGGSVHVICARAASEAEEGGVGDDDRLLVSEGPREVTNRSTEAGAPEPVTLDHLAVGQWTFMAHDVGGAAPVVGSEHDVHPLRSGSIEREPVQHGR